MTQQHGARRRTPHGPLLGCLALLAGSLILVRTVAPAPAVPTGQTTMRYPGVRGAADRRLVITEGGTAQQPAVYDGKGRSVDGITVEADHVVVRGYTLQSPTAPGIEVTGNDITVRDNTITSPHGGDGDGLRFFGDNLKILHNTVKGTRNTGDRHADCMQTFASDTPPSQNVLIEGNRCTDIDNMCLMAEGPHDGEGDGHGHTFGFTIRDNYCETLEASQTLMFEDVQRAVRPEPSARRAAGRQHRLVRTADEARASGWPIGRPSAGPRNARGPMLELRNFLVR